VCVLRETTKKVVKFFAEEKCTPDKILATHRLRHKIRQIITRDVVIYSFE